MVQSRYALYDSVTTNISKLHASMTDLVETAGLFDKESSFTHFLIHHRSIQKSFLLEGSPLPHRRRNELDVSHWKNRIL